MGKPGTWQVLFGMRQDAHGLHIDRKEFGKAMAGQAHSKKDSQPGGKKFACPRASVRVTQEGDIHTYMHTYIHCARRASILRQQN
jgi:hypothetical protein